MKTAFFLALAFLANFNTAEARSYRHIINAELTSFNLDRDFPLRFTARDGNVAVDTFENKIMLSIGTGLMTYPENPRASDYSFYSDFNLRDRYVEKTCNVNVYVGEKTLDRHPPVAVVRRIEVRDNTHNNCPTFVPLAPTEVIMTDVEVKRGSSRVIATSMMYGDSLK